MTEEEIKASFVGEVKQLTDKILVADYDPDWPRLFVREAARVRGTLGDRVLLLEHTGSTSVPGLAAKPRIDMCLAVADSGDESTYLTDLETAGYRLAVREPDWHEHRVFKGPDTDINLHVFTIGSPEIDRILVFRDWLRTHDDDRELYEGTKRDLATRDWKYVQNYADAKTEIVETIIARATAARAAAG
jgi:GrpB-like predicted nucleotidyltransferase (UPF0157 family)